MPGVLVLSCEPGIGAVDVSNLAPGIYFYKVKFIGQIQTGKLLFVR